MDRSHNGVQGRASKTSSTRVLDDRLSVEAAVPRNAAPMQQPATSRLQKKRSNAGVPTTPSRPPASLRTSNPPSGDGGNDGGLAHSGKTRTGSIRTAMRKIFGRRSKDVHPPEPIQEPVHEEPLREPIRVSPPRHQYHRSESSALLPPPIEVPEPAGGVHPQAGPSSPAPRSVSESFQPMSPYASSANKRPMGSPYAVQFPKSAQLKPLDLGNPFAAPNNQLRRRKTLPTILPADLGGSDPAPPPVEASSDPPPVPPVPPDLARTASTTAAGPSSRERSLRSSKRRSRSVEDVKRSPGSATALLPRKRSEEIQYWRNSVQQDRYYIAPAPAPQAMSFSETIGEVDSDGNDAPAPLISHSPVRLSMPPGSEQEPDSPTTDLNKDLEDRVARLEAGLRTFQRSLQRLTADRNRRTVIMGNIAGRRSSEDVRTPSMLAETLLDFPAPVAYERSAYESPAPAHRPSTSPRPQAPSHSDDPFIFDFSPTPASPHEPEPLPPSPTPPHTRTSPPRSPVSHTSSTAEPQPHTFRSLYQMLTDERSARRRLETEMRSLREELSDLHSQVASSSSNVQSARSSYIPTDPGAGSLRLRELLRETETYPSPPHLRQAEASASSSSYYQQQHHRQASGTSSRWPQRLSEISTSHPVISRFSGTESEGATDPDDLETPLDAYQTPAEEQSRWDLAEQARDAPR